MHRTPEVMDCWFDSGTSSTSCVKVCNFDKIHLSINDNLQSLILYFVGSYLSMFALCDFPVCDKKFVDSDLEKDMSFAIASVELGRACRNASNMKNRQPLSNIYIKSDIKLKDEGMLDIIAKELNIKAAQIVEDNSSFVGYEIKPQLKTIGPKYGKLLGGIKQYLANCDASKPILIWSVTSKPASLRIV